MRKKKVINESILPTFDSLMNPLFNALIALGGSGSIDEIYEKVIEMEKISEEITSLLHNPEKSNQTELGYRLAWARTYLKKYGFLENSSRGVWTLTQSAKEQKVINAQEVVKAVRDMDKPAISKAIKSEAEIELQPVDTPEEILEWKEELYLLLTKSISPDAFERLTQRLLRESGFVQVEVTGKTGDGGIDGKGIARINGLMSFHVIFQCKKYQCSFSAG